MISFQVVGTPAPQGSKRHVGNGVMIESANGNRPWRAAVAAEAALAASTLDGPALDMPLILEVEFRFAMPRSRSKAKRERGQCPKVSAPDLDKLVRSVGDALKEGGLIRDDSIITEIRARKVETTGWTGASIALAGDLS